MATIYKEQAKVFKAFCDETRLRILQLLRSGEKCACVLQEQLNLRQSGLSYHMKILVESGVVESRKEGKWTYYTISEKGSAYAATLLKRLTTPKAVKEGNNCCKTQPSTNNFKTEKHIKII
ncbi:MAG: ArsR family transcriptional regulator, arsenate/arsenite/antimonite-responsive transcriptional [Petrotoga sp.]|nr:ArsR family transcriptional regulator, arsenate/arsenite/antimonite-responsive transcriptional [Petrotoga sp.]